MLAGTLEPFQGSVAYRATELEQIGVGARAASGPGERP
jgi:hypothetical protein